MTQEYRLVSEPTLYTADSANEKRMELLTLLEQNIYTEETIQLFVDGLLDSDRRVRDVCVRAFTREPQKQSSDKAKAVAPLCLHPDIEIRNSAGEVLLALGESSVEPLLPYLSNPDFDVRKYASDVIGLVGNENHAPYIFPLLFDTDANVRYSAIETMGNLRSGIASGYIMGMYSFDEEARPFIIETLGKIGGQYEQHFLLSLLYGEQDEMVRITAIDALSMCSCDTALREHLLRILPSYNDELKSVLVRAIVSISLRGGYDATMPDEYKDTLRTMILSEEPENMHYALSGLGNVYSPEDSLALVRALSKGDNEVRNYILQGLLCSSPTDSISTIISSYLVYSNCSDCNNQAGVLELLELCLTFMDSIPDESRTILFNEVIRYILSNDVQGSNDIVELLCRINPTLVSSLIAHNTSDVNTFKALEITGIVQQWM
jgi:HEAT repeat protein